MQHAKIHYVIRLKKDEPSYAIDWSAENRVFIGGPIEKARMFDSQKSAQTWWYNRRDVLPSGSADYWEIEAIAVLEKPAPQPAPKRGGPEYLYRDRRFQMWLLTRGTREQIIRWLCWNDANGDYEDNPEENGYMSLEDVREAMWEQLAD